MSRFEQEHTYATVHGGGRHIREQVKEVRFQSFSSPSFTITSTTVNSRRSEVAVAAISPQETEADYESDFELDKVNLDDGHDGDDVLDDDGHGDFELDKVNKTFSKTNAG